MSASGCGVSGITDSPPVLVTCTGTASTCKVKVKRAKVMRAKVMRAKVKGAKVERAKIKRKSMGVVFNTTPIL